ncbi:hypothetical protein GmHk_18G052528 [Glycine max]|nr:hypothetical protein GmHk_18G052528 [Glycine max]
MKNVSIVVYCDGDIFHHLKGYSLNVLSENMSLDTLRKTIMSTIAGGGCVEYKYMELKHDDDVGKTFFIFSKFSNKGLVELNAIFGRSLDEIFALLHKPRNPRFAYEIIALMHDKSM